MRVYLFLYPIKWYIDREIEDNKEERKECLSRINAIIEARYRSQGFQIYWLLFGKEGSEAEADFGVVEPLFEIRPEDKTLSSGLSLLTHRSKLEYPDPCDLLERIPKSEQLVIGGFHLADCVDKLATQAHSSGVLVFVDEDTTDMFFKLRRMYGLSPILSTPEEYAARFRDMLLQVFQRVQHNTYEYLLELHRAERREKPWLVMI